VILCRFSNIDLREWHPWFAWFPVPTPDGMVWLETIDRRDACSEAASAYCGPIWAYRRATAR